MQRYKKIGKLKKGAEAAQRLGIGFEKLDRAVFEPERAYEKLGQLGVKWVRLQSGWARTEKEPGKYDFAWLDDIVDTLIGMGMQPWICLCYGNPLYDDFAKTVFGAVGCPPIDTEEQKKAWRDYVTQVAIHYRDRVRHFEIWNEPDGQWCWKKGPSGTELGLFSIETAKALKQGNPDAYVIGGAVCQSPIPFLQEAFRTGMGDYMDGISFHEYVYNEQNVTQKVKALRALCAMHGMKADIIQGESGSQSKPNGNGALRHGAWTQRIQAKQLLRHLTIDLLNDVLFTSFFSCVDMIEALNGKTGDLASYLDFGYFGVLGADFNEQGIATGAYVPKESYYALQNLASLLQGETQTVELPVYFHRESAPHLGDIMTIAGYDMLYGGFRLGNGSYAMAYWKPMDLMTTEFEGAVTVETALPGRIRLVDPMDGSVYEIPQERDPFGTALLKYLPIRDYPLYLVFGDLPLEETEAN